MEVGEPEKLVTNLRWQRQVRGWSLRHVVDQLHKLGEQDGRIPGVTVDMVSQWECGKSMPSPFYREKFCKLYDLTAEQLGFVSLPVSSAATPATQIQPAHMLPASFPPTMLSEEAASDPAAWYGCRQGYISEVVSGWNHHQACYNDLQMFVDNEIRRFNIMAQQHDSNDYLLSRRQAISAITGMSAYYLARVQRGDLSMLVPEEFLPRCAAGIVACRHLLNGSELALVESVLPTYIPPLVELAQQPSRHQQAAAELVSQAYTLRSILALHRNKPKVREGYALETVKYSRITGDRNRLVHALAELAGAYRGRDGSLEVVQAFQEILPSLHEAAPLLQSAVYAKLAWAYAHSKQEQEALRYRSLAYEIFPVQPENDPSFLYVQYGLPWLYLWEGFTDFALHEHYPNGGYDRQAWEAFAHVGGLQPKLIVPERIRLEVMNHQAEVAIALDDRDLCCACLETGVDGAKALGSQRRYSEAFQVYQQIPKPWRSESRVKDLADRFVW